MMMDENMGDANAPEGTSPGAELRGKRSRASKPKVKTGCQTCKIRRVKCDETKPSCMRCLKFGHTCDGYAPKNPLKSPALGSSSRPLVPKSQTLCPILPSSSEPLSPISALLNKPPSPPPLLRRVPSQSLFQNDQEYRYFQTFCSQTAVNLSTFFSKDLWTRLMLQACESSPSIRRAVISIGALNLTPSSSTRRPNEVGTLRHQFAFRQYNKSICLMRRDIAGGRHDLRTTLIGCLLFYCFESFQGYHEFAISQVYNGLRMIRDWATSFYKPDPDGSWRNRAGAEDPYVMEEDIQRAFNNLEIQVMSYADGRNADLHEHYRHSGQDAINDMPSVFRDLSEARTMLELVIRRSMHWLRSTMHLHNFSMEKMADGGVIAGAVERDGVARLFFDVDPRFEEQNATIKEYERWNAAFQPLLRRARAPDGAEMFCLASMLRLHWLSGYMSIASNNCRSNRINGGKFTRELGELVEIARILEQQPSWARRRAGEGVFDMEIIMPLMTVGWVHRHRALRKEAVELLLRSPRKEGVWDGSVIGKAMEWLAGIEEEGLMPEERDFEYVPERATAKSIKMSFETERREAHVSCMQPVKGSYIEREVSRETIIPW